METPEGETEEKPRTSIPATLKKYKNKPFVLRLKRLTKKAAFHYVLVASLVIAAYYIGSLRAEVAQLKATSRAAVATSTASSGQASQPTGEVPPVTDEDHIRGDRDARVILIEYSDLECPFCKRFHPTMQQVLKDYKGDVAWVYRHYPLAFHANAQKESEASECVAELGGEDKFWQYVDKMFERTTSNGTGFALDKLGPLAAEVGVNQSKFQQCLDSGKYTQFVRDQMDAGTKAGVRGTPGTFAVTGDGDSKLISGALPIEQLKQSIDEVLKK